jgi:hypothetical protein
MPPSDKTDADTLAVAFVLTLEFAEIASVPVRLDHVASLIVDANHCIGSHAIVGEGSFGGAGEIFARRIVVKPAEPDSYLRSKRIGSSKKAPNVPHGRSMPGIQIKPEGDQMTLIHL